MRVCVSDLWLWVCVMSLSLCTLVALLRDSLNCCNNCFSSEGGLEVCESQCIRADLKKRHQMPGLWTKSQTMRIIYWLWARQMLYKWHEGSRPVLGYLVGLVVTCCVEPKWPKCTFVTYECLFKTCLMCLWWLDLITFSAFSHIRFGHQGASFLLFFGAYVRVSGLKPSHFMWIK